MATFPAATIVDFQHDSTPATSLSEEALAMLPIGLSGLSDIAASPVLDAEILPPVESQTSIITSSSDCESGSTIAYGVSCQPDSRPFDVERGFWRIYHGSRELLKYAVAYQDHRDGTKPDLELPPQAGLAGGEPQPQPGPRLLPRVIDLEAMTQLSWGVMRAVADISAYDRRVHMLNRDGSIPHTTSAAKGEIYDAHSRVTKRKRQKNRMATSANNRPIQHHQHQQNAPSTVPCNVCKTCGTANSPQWRYGPEGLLNLCNVCGLLYAKKTQRRKY